MYIVGVKFGDTFSPGCMFRPRDRRMDTLGLRHKKLFVLYSFVTWWGKRIWLPSNQCCPWSHSAWGRLTHCSQSLASDRPPQRFAEPGKSFHSFLKMLHLHEHHHHQYHHHHHHHHLHEHHVDVHQGCDRDPNHGSTIQDKNSNLGDGNYFWINIKCMLWKTFAMVGEFTFMITVAVKSESAMFSIIQAPT